MSKFRLLPCESPYAPNNYNKVPIRMLIRPWLLLPFLMLLAFNSYAQTMTPDFTANVTSGCAPLGVAFKDLTTGNPKFWNWDFGNGTLSNVQNPNITFSQPGTYTVTLVVRNADGTNGITKTNYITVLPAPSTSFSANITTGCVPVNVQFTDKSTSSNGSIVAWQWDFGDGNSSTSQNPQNTYNATGFYNVTLTVTSSSGCKGSTSANRYIRIVPSVKPEFDVSKALSCQAPYNINFTNLSTGPGNLTYQWDLGNNTSSTQTNPSATYAATGTYNVTLTATSDFGCSGTITKPLPLSGPTTAIKAPDTVCQNSHVWFVNNSSVAPQKNVWDFGNGDQSTNIDDSTIYTSPGTYKVKLFNVYSSCADSAIKNIVVLASPDIDFKTANAAACKGPLNVTFTDASPAPIVSWKWNFGDGGTGNGQTVTHTYNSDGTYNVSVVFVDNMGCQGTITKPSVVKIVKPTVGLTGVPAGGCIPYTATLGDTATTVDGVASYQWDFGDGATGTGAPPVTHTYNSAGTFPVTLTITTTGGCTTSTTVADAVKTGTPPVPSFSISSTDNCASQFVHFTDQTPPPVNEWQWDFGDGTSSPTENPDHKYTDTGVFVIKLTAINNKCAATSAGQTVHIKPAVAKFKYAVDCSTLAVMFTDLSITDPSYGAISYLWDFGDGNTSTLATPTVMHSYAALGSYTVTLTVTNGACSDTYVSTVTIVKEKAAFTAPSTVCKNATFAITSTNNPLQVKLYEWQLDGGAFIAGKATTSASFATTGPHTVVLRVTDINGCVDVSAPATVTVTSPTASFTASGPGGCKNAVITFNDASASPNPPLKTWTFDFGDGQTQSFTSAPFKHTYTDTGEFVVKMAVQDNLGCVDTFKLPDTIFISTPKAGFNADLTTVCPKSDVHFTDASSGTGLTYLWNFGNGATSTQQNPVYSYGGNNATYNVKLVITDRGGCSDSITRTGYITTLAPVPAFDIEDTATICPPIETKFTFRGSDYQSFEWDFGDGSTSTLQNPSHFYNSYGDFIAKLYVTGFGGCLDSTSKTVHVYNPYTVTTLNYSPLDSCNHITVDFSITTPPHLKFFFTFGDGTIDSSMATTYQHVYSSPAFYSPSVQYTDAQGCTAGVGGPVIKVIGADPFFAEDRKKFCDSGTVYFTNYTIGNDPVVTRTWDFGDGSATSTDVDPIHYYQQPGLYSASQTVTTQTGCSKTIADTIRVYRTPNPSITGDSIVCINQPLNLQGALAIPDTAISWKWSLPNGATDTSQNLSVQFAAAGNYTVHLQASNLLGCSDTTSKGVYVPPTPNITIANNPVIPVSTGVTLPVTYGPNIATYTWTPATNLSCTDCATPYANPKKTTTYNVKVTDVFGCTNNSDITVTVVCNGLNYFIPNTFSPNGDGVNDVFAPRGVGLNRINSMRIFNRWGELVFEKMNFMANDRTPTGGWDGTYKGKPASADVYIYIIEFVCDNSAIVPVKGNVALIR